MKGGWGQTFKKLLFWKWWPHPVLIFMEAKGSLSFFHDPEMNSQMYAERCEWTFFISSGHKNRHLPSAHIRHFSSVVVACCFLCSSIYIYITLRNYLIDKCYAMSLYLQGADLFLLVYLYFHIYHCNL